MPKGYAGKILKVNLTTQAITVDEPPEAFTAATWAATASSPTTCSRNCPRAPTPRAGQPAHLCRRHGHRHPRGRRGPLGGGRQVPLTGGYGEADGGGFFGAELKRAGYDAVVVSGRAAEPVYLYIDDGVATLRPAAHLWGKTTLETQEALHAELGDARVRLAMIGPGGEKMVRTACVIHDLRHAAGRTGLGAVMGSKNLKAVAARGRGNVPVGDPEALRELSRWMRDNWKDKAWGMHDLGTPGGIMDLHHAGQLPTRNFQDGQFEGAEKITGTTLRDTIMIGREGCYACPIRCKRVVQVDEPGLTVNPIYGGPEYETIGAFGSNCGVDDLKAISKCHEICNAYSLDTISTGMLVSFAMECYENGLLTKEDTGGLDLRLATPRRWWR